MPFDQAHPSFQVINTLAARAPGGNYVPYRIVGELIYLSGQTSSRDGRVLYAGKVGQDIGVHEGYAAARLCMENLFASLRMAVQADWSRVLGCVKLTGFINSEAPFGDGPKVMNGASDLVIELMGNSGQHARSAVGVSALPANAAVEVEAIFHIAPPAKPERPEFKP